MNLSESEDALFDRWSGGREKFVRDGAVDQRAFLKSEPSLLFLLKEVNDERPDGGNWDLREFIRNTDRGATWNNVSRWVVGIQSLPEEIPWPTVEEIKVPQYRDVLRPIAAMNLKKSPGGHTTVVRSFWDAVHEDADFIREQFSLYQADIVICCGSVVAEAFDTILKEDNTPNWLSTSRGVKYLEYLPGKYVIEYSHPEARVSANLLYYGLVDALRELRNDASGS